MEIRKLVSQKEILWRRSYCKPPNKFENPDGTATSRTFTPREKDNGELSVNVKSLTTLEKTIVDAAKFILFELPNKSVFEIGLVTYHDPYEDGSNDAHAVIVMDIDDDITPRLLANKSKRVYFNS